MYGTGTCVVQVYIPQVPVYRRAAGSLKPNGISSMCTGTTCLKLILFGLYRVCAQVFTQAVPGTHVRVYMY